MSHVQISEHICKRIEEISQELGKFLGYEEARDLAFELQGLSLTIKLMADARDWQLKPAPTIIQESKPLFGGV